MCFILALKAPPASFPALILTPPERSLYKPLTTPHLELVCAGIILPTPPNPIPFAIPSMSASTSAKTVPSVSKSTASILPLFIAVGALTDIPIVLI